MSNRIKVAEAMGGPTWEAYIDPGKHPECIDLPDPFTDANDDYAVLEWVRNQVPTNNNGIKWASHDLGWWFYKHLKDNPAEYEIGDYARAAVFTFLSVMSFLPLVRRARQVALGLLERPHCFGIIAVQPPRQPYIRQVVFPLWGTVLMARLPVSTDA